MLLGLLARKTLTFPHLGSKQKKMPQDHRSRPALAQLLSGDSPTCWLPEDSVGLIWLYLVCVANSLEALGLPAWGQEPCTCQATKERPWPQSTRHHQMPFLPVQIPVLQDRALPWLHRPSPLGGWVGVVLTQL